MARIMPSRFHSFVDRHPDREAFVGNRLGRVVDFIVEQGDLLLRDRGVTFSSTAASTVLLLSERTNLSSADLARELDHPHQLVTKRVETLIQLGLVRRKSDPHDGRRKVLALTKKGQAEAALLGQAVHDASAAFSAIYDEIGVNVSEVAASVAGALARRSLAERIKDGQIADSTGKDGTTQ